MTEPDAASHPRAPAVFRWAVTLFAVQTVLVWCYVGFLIYQDITIYEGVTAKVADRRGAALVTIYFGLYAALFAGLAIALVRRRSWARGPAVVLQLLLVAIGYFMVKGGVPWFGVPLLVLALAGIALLLAPGSRGALGVR